MASNCASYVCLYHTCVCARVYVCTSLCVCLQACLCVTLYDVALFFFLPSVSVAVSLCLSTCASTCVSMLVSYGIFSVRVCICASPYTRPSFFMCFPALPPQRSNSTCPPHGAPFSGTPSSSPSPSSLWCAPPPPAPRLPLSSRVYLCAEMDFQTESETYTMLNGFGTVVNALGLRAKAYLPQISGTVKVRRVSTRGEGVGGDMFCSVWSLTCRRYRAQLGARCEWTGVLARGEGVGGCSFHA